MDIEILPKWKDIPLRSKCYPMSKEDMQQIEDQVFELVKTGMVDEYKIQEYPTFCSPTMLVNQEDSKVKEWLEITGNLINEHFLRLFAEYGIFG